MAAASQPGQLLATGRVRRRKRMNRAVELLATLTAFAAVALLALMVGSVVVKALPALSWDLFTKNQATFGEAGGGIQNALIGSMVLVGVAAATATSTSDPMIAFWIPPPPSPNVA